MTRHARVVLSSLAVVLLGACAHGSTGPAVTSVATVSTTSTTAPPSSLSRVVIWGDSLSVQAAEALRVEGRARGLVVTVEAYFGLAPCDVAKLILPSLVRDPPDALVLAFSGNNFSPCMQSAGRPMSGSVYFATYRHDITRLVAAATGRRIPVLVVGPPAFPPSENHPDRVTLTNLYSKIVSENPGSYSVSTMAALTPHGFVRQLPCIPGETAALGCHGGLITVRSGNGIHFDDPRDVACVDHRNVCHYTAGGHRYADAMLAGLAKIPGLSYRPAPPTVGVPIVVTQN